ncbi:MAG: hypothetical protein ABI432_19940 [Flavobacteriales bacterium]
MNRTAAFVLLVTLASTGFGQTLFRITNVTVSEKEDVHRGNEVTANMNGDEGSDRLVIFTDKGIIVKAWVKVSTHNVRRSSVKNSAVNVIFELDLIVDGKKDERRVEKIFYGDQARTTHISEKFTMKQGITMRVITVDFDGSVE